MVCTSFPVQTQTTVNLKFQNLTSKTTKFACKVFHYPLSFCGIKAKLKLLALEVEMRKRGNYTYKHCMHAQVYDQKTYERCKKGTKRNRKRMRARKREREKKRGREIFKLKVKCTVSTNQIKPFSKAKAF